MTNEQGGMLLDDMIFSWNRVATNQSLGRKPQIFPRIWVGYFDLIQQQTGAVEEVHCVLYVGSL